MLDLKAILAKILNVVVGLKLSSVSYQIANTNHIRNVAGSIQSIMLPSGHYIMFFALAFVTNTTRGASTAVFRFVAQDGYVFSAVNPYFYTCITNGSMGNSYGNNDGYFFNTNVQWNANTEYRVSGVGLFNKTNTHI